MPLIKEVRR